MPYKFRRMCPLCYRQDLLYLADHLRQVHKLSSDERQPLLKAAIFSHQVTPSIVPGVQTQALYSPHILQHGMQQYPLSPQLPRESPQSMKPKQLKTIKVQSVNCLETQAYPEFMFQHMFSMLVVGPSQSGKTYFNLYNNYSPGTVLNTRVRNLYTFIGFTVNGSQGMMK